MVKQVIDPAVISSIAHLELIARQAVEGTVSGIHHSHFMGRNVEFSEHRPYNPGDELRHIDWRAYAKTDRFHIKLFEEDTNLRAVLLTDISASMNFGLSTITKLEYAQQLSAALSHLILAQGDSVGLTIFDSEIQTYIPPRNRKDQWGNILETLVEFTSSNRESSIAHTLTEMTEWLKKRGMVIIISDMIEDPDTLLHNLAILSSSHQEVIIFHVLTPEEIELPFSGTVEFKPLEGDDDPMLTTPKRLRARYQEKVHSFLEKYKNGCAKLKIDYNLVKTDQPLEQVLREYLQHRFKVAIRS